MELLYTSTKPPSLSSVPYYAGMDALQVKRVDVCLRIYVYCVSPKRVQVPKYHGIRCQKPVYCVWDLIPQYLGTGTLWVCVCRLVHPCDEKAHNPPLYSHVSASVFTKPTGSQQIQRPRSNDMVNTVKTCTDTLQVYTATWTLTCVQVYPAPFRVMMDLIGSSAMNSARGTLHDAPAECHTRPTSLPEVSSTWVPKVCQLMSFWTLFEALVIVLHTFRILAGIMYRRWNPK